MNRRISLFGGLVVMLLPAMAAVLLMYETSYVAAVALAAVSLAAAVVFAVGTFRDPDNFVGAVRAERDVASLSSDGQGSRKVRIADAILASHKGKSKLVTGLCIALLALSIALVVLTAVAGTPALKLAAMIEGFLTAAVAAGIVVLISSRDSECFSAVHKAAGEDVNAHLHECGVSDSVARAMTGNGAYAYGQKMMADDAMRVEFTRTQKRTLLCGVALAMVFSGLMIGVTVAEKKMAEGIFAVVVFAIVSTGILAGFVYAIINTKLNNKLFARNIQKLYENNDDLRIKLQGEYMRVRKKAILCFTIGAVVGLVLGAALGFSGVFKDPDFTYIGNAIMSIGAMFMIGVMLALFVWGVFFVLYTRRAGNITKAIDERDWKKESENGGQE